MIALKSFLGNEEQVVSFAVNTIEIQIITEKPSFLFAFT